MNSIYMEGILFVAVFGGMSIASIIISKKQAKAYVPEIVEEKEEKPLSEYKQRIKELLRLVDRGLLTDEEFQILKAAKEAHK